MNSTSKASLPTRSHATTRYKGKEIAKPITPPSESASEEDSDPEQAQKDKDMQKNLALIAKYFKKLYKPTNNNLRTSSNTRNKNMDTTPRYKNDNQTGQFGNQRAVNVVGARETVGGLVVQQSGIQCFNCKEFGHYAKECRKPKRLADTNEEIDEQELEAHYSYMAKIQEVPNADSGTDAEPLEQDDQNDVECDDEHVALANLIANLKLDVDENKKIQKQLKKANATLTQELTECKSILAETSRTLGESNSIRDSCFSIKQDLEFERFNALMIVQYDLTNLNEVVKEKHDELVKQSLLTKSHYEGLVKEKTKVITDLKLKEEKDIDKMISMENQLKFLNEIVYKRSQSIQTIHMLAPKCPTFNGRPTFANPRYLKKAQNEIPCLYAIPHDQSDPANRLVPDREETLTLDNESRSKLNKDLVKPFDYIKLNSLYEIFKPPTQHYEIQFAQQVKYSFAKLEKHSISLEIALQECQEQLKNDTVCKEKASNVFRKEREQYFEIQDLKAQLQDKNIAISELKKLIEKCKGKSVETKFDKPSIVRQPNAQRIPKPSVLGKLAPFSDSLARNNFVKKKSVSKTNESEGLSKPVTSQNLPQTASQAVRNTNVIKPGMYRIESSTTQTRAPQLTQTSRNTNPRVSTSTGVAHRTNVSRPKPRSNQMKDKVVPNTSHVKFKKIEVEEHPRISSISNQTKSVTACNDSLTSRTSNVNAVCATCGKCVFNSNHDACVSKYLNDVNARTRKPKSQANKSVATPHKKTVASESTTQKSKSYYRMLYEKTNKEWKWWIAQQCPSGYKWVPKTKMKWVPKVRNESVPKRVSFAIDNVSRITNVLKLTNTLGSNLSCIPSSSNSLEDCLPKLKYVKDQLCWSCEISKAKRSSFKSKAVPSSKGRLEQLQPHAILRIDQSSYRLMERRRITSL
ncbi:retrovirus-related pol polyprotein from transposon TNT 1-94, partial [Tanacetum coccineum]